VLDFDELVLLFVVLVVLVALCDAAPFDPLWDAAMAEPPPASRAAVAVTARTDLGACIVPPFSGFGTANRAGL